MSYVKVMIQAVFGHQKHKYWAQNATLSSEFFLLKRQLINSLPPNIILFFLTPYHVDNKSCNNKNK